ncbi:hypothetical protein QJS10_CPB15g01420 [Acorus calamus]|uniref:SWIM-type domain-containing protein n=1 Tax=Acorus calamus TaxID=4465 RepID=A0AAV9D7B2_ACOCL|nr:hypothetical protein QJS10_CPB15g01420 [Acorus calamus]
MTKLDARRRCALRWKHALVPNALRNVQDVRKMTNGFIIRRSDDMRAEIISPTHRFVVDLIARECSCNRWTLTGMPCSHATALIQEIRGLDIVEFIDPCYYTEAYLATYELRVNPLMDRQLWEHVELGYTVLPPMSRRPRGRPKTKRIKDPNEAKRTKRMHKCSRCENWSHHKSSCKESLQAIEAQGTQALPKQPRKQQPKRRANNKKTISTPGTVEGSQPHVKGGNQSVVGVSSQVKWADGKKYENKFIDTLKKYG